MTNLVAKARSAVLWNTGFNLFRDLLQFGTMLMLVRMLEPASYGEFALVMSMMGVLTIFSQNNFIAHLLQVKELANAQYQNHFTAGAAIQAGIFLITNLVALVCYWLPTYAQIAPYLHVMSITYLLEWPCELRRKMLEREFDWKRLRLLHALGLVAGALLALVMACSDSGTYALVLPGMLVTLPFIFDLFFTAKWRPTWEWSWPDYQPAWRFGLSRVGSGLMTSGRQLLESSVLTVVVGFAMLGFFGRAIGLAQLFCQKFSTQLMYAIYPVLTRLDNREGDPTRLGGLVLRLVAWVSVPLAIMFAQLAEPVVRVIYGENWLEVIPLLPWAMVWGALSAITHTSYTLLLAKHQTRLCLYSDLVLLLGIGLALLIGLPHGLVAYLIAINLLQLVVLCLLSFWLYQHNTLSFFDMVYAYVPPLIAGIIGWGGLRLLTSVYADYGFNIFGSVVWGCAFICIYFLVIRIAFQHQMLGLVNYFPARRLIARFLRLNIQL